MNVQRVVSAPGRGAWRRCEECVIGRKRVYAVKLGISQTLNHVW